MLLLYQWGLEYYDYFALQRGKTPHKKMDVLGMIHNWWWGSISGVLEHIGYRFIAITSWSTLTWRGSTCVKEELAG